MASQSGFDAFPDDVPCFFPPSLSSYSWCSYESFPVQQQVAVPGTQQAATLEKAALTPGPGLGLGLGLGPGQEEGRSINGQNLAGEGQYGQGFKHESQPECAFGIIRNPVLIPSQSPLGKSDGKTEEPTMTTGPTTTKKRPDSKAKQPKDVYSASELFFLVATANDLNVYGAPRSERTNTWSRLHSAHEAKGYKRPLNSLRRKLDELVAYHSDLDSSKVTQGTRDLFMTESAQVKFGASLDVLKNSFDSQKKPDSEKIREKKIKDENRIGGAYLRDAMKTTWQRNLLSQAEDSAEAGMADSSLNAADDELSTGSDKENITTNKGKPSRKRKAHVIELDSSDNEVKSTTTTRIKRHRKHSSEPRFDWSKYLKEEHESRSSFEASLMEKLDEGNKHNKDVFDFMKSAHEDTCMFQNRLLDLLSRKL